MCRDVPGLQKAGAVLDTCHCTMYVISDMTIFVRCLHNTRIVIANEAKQSLTPYNHNRLPRRPASRNDRKRNYAKVSLCHNGWLGQI